MSRLSRLQAYLAEGPGEDAWWTKERSRLEKLWQNEQEAFPGWVVGTDEVGRGPMAGPMVAAAAAAQEMVFIPGLNDSKKLTGEERELVMELIFRSPIRVELEIVSVDAISRGNLHHLSLGAMQAALKRLKLKEKPRLVLVDGKYPLPEAKLPQRPLIGGDRHSALIAAASIVAKVTRDRIMRDLAAQHPGYGWEQNVGYCTEDHRLALVLLGPTPHHRRNYAPVKALLPTQLMLEGLQ
ncbi:ribonuclease HII [bacterium]|nr:ribonuclease HII [bacterium]